MIQRSLAGNFINALLLGSKAFIIVLVLGVVLAVISPIFLTSTNLFNVLRQVCTSTIVAFGFTFILALGEIDLSVGSVVGFVGMIMGKLMVNYGVSVPFAILVGLLTGAVFGILNSTLITLFDLPAFIATLATSSLFRGGLYIITNMVPVTKIPNSFLAIGQGYVGIVPIPVLILVLVGFITYMMGNYSTFGRYVIAVGGNREAARVSGINIKLVRMGVFITSGVCASLGSMILTARAASAQIGAGLNMEMDVIAAVVIGGTALTGGNMNIIGTFFGCLVVGMVTNGLNLLGINSNFQIIAKGLLILFALILDRTTTKFYANLTRKMTLRENVNTQK
jgi:ribose/xylose/arabinose/galactoside ABC-type transport system permease subunit